MKRNLILLLVYQIIKKSTIFGENNCVESVLHDESQHVCDKISVIASIVSTTVAFTNPGSDTASGWDTCVTSNWNIYSVVHTEKLQKVEKIRDAEIARLSTNLMTLKQKLHTRSKQLREICVDETRTGSLLTLNGNDYTTSNAHNHNLSHSHNKYNRFGN